MAMRIIPGFGLMTVAFIDPNKNFGEEGQYVKTTDLFSKLTRLADAARRDGKEIRWYYQDLTTDDDEAVASKVIITEIPPGHVQPFHSHHTVHEMTIVMEGHVVAVDSDSLREEDCKSMSVFDLCGSMNRGRVIQKMQMIIEGPGKRHTIVNKSDAYALMYTVQTARLPIDEFPSDWHRDKPAT